MLHSCKRESGDHSPLAPRHVGNVPKRARRWKVGGRSSSSCGGGHVKNTPAMKRGPRRPGSRVACPPVSSIVFQRRGAIFALLLLQRRPGSSTRSIEPRCAGLPPSLMMHAGPERTWDVPGLGRAGGAIACACAVAQGPSSSTTSPVRFSSLDPGVAGSHQGQLRPAERGWRGRGTEERLPARRIDAVIRRAQEARPMSLSKMRSLPAAVRLAAFH